MVLVLAAAAPRCCSCIWKPFRRQRPALEAACVLVGGEGAIGGRATRLRLGAGGLPLGRGRWRLKMWVGGVGARLAFAVAAGNGAGPAIARLRRAPHHRLGAGGGAGDDGPG
jgi:hypothetical protein